MLFSIGDFIDLSLMLQRRAGAVNPLRRLFMRGEERTRTWWSRTVSPVRNWWDVPAVVGRWNEKITGDAAMPYMRFIGNRYFMDTRRTRLLSIGCGAGRKELAIASLWPEWTIDGLDASPPRIEAAKKNAREAHAGNVSFISSPVSDFTFPADTYDIILFDSSLHHLKDFDRLFNAIKPSLTEKGLVLINEYTGADRFQWTTRQLRAATALLRKIPPRYRQLRASRLVKNRIYRPGCLRMLLSDPSEAINSSRILPSLHAHFATILEIPLGGNLLHPLLKDIAHHFIADDETVRTILRDLFTEEDRFLDDNPSDFTFGVYRPPRWIPAVNRGFAAGLPQPLPHDVPHRPPPGGLN